MRRGNCAEQRECASRRHPPRTQDGRARPVGSGRYNVSACSEECIRRLPQGADNYVKAPHRGGLGVIQPPSRYSNNKAPVLMQ